MSVRLVTPTHFAIVRFVGCVNMTMLFSITRIGKPPIASFEVTFERLLTCVNPLVDLEILRPGKDLAATRKWARKRLLSSMDSDVVHQFVFSLERAPFSRAVFPETRMIRDLRTAHMFHGQVRDDLMKGAKDLAARLLW